MTRRPTVAIHRYDTRDRGLHDPRQRIALAGKVGLKHLGRRDVQMYPADLKWMTYGVPFGRLTTRQHPDPVPCPTPQAQFPSHAPAPFRSGLVDPVQQARRVIGMNYLLPAMRRQRVQVRCPIPKDFGPPVVNHRDPWAHVVFPCAYTYTVDQPAQPLFGLIRAETSIVTPEMRRGLPSAPPGQNAATRHKPDVMPALVAQAADKVELIRPALEQRPRGVLCGGPVGVMHQVRKFAQARGPLDPAKHLLPAAVHRAGPHIQAPVPDSDLTVLERLLRALAGKATRSNLLIKPHGFA